MLQSLPILNPLLKRTPNNAFHWYEPHANYWRISISLTHSLLSNGDLFKIERGIGRKHLFEIQRRIGESSFTEYNELRTIIDARVQTDHKSRGYIVILPKHDTQIENCVYRLGARTGAEVCIFSSEEDRS